MYLLKCLYQATKVRRHVFVKVPVPRQVSERSCIIVYVLGYTDSERSCKIVCVLGGQRQ